MANKVVKLKESDIKDLIKKIIEEQVNNVSADVGAIMREIQNFDTDEQAIVNIVKKYKTLAELQNFFTQYKTISGKDFGNDIGLSIKLGDDNTEITDLRNHLKTVGLGFEASRQGWNITGLTAQVSAGNGRIQNITNTLKTVDAQGIIKNPASVINNTKWEDYVKTYNVTQAEIDQAKASMGGGAQTNTQQRQRRQPDPKVQELQKTLVGTVVNGRKFTEADVDGVMGPITRAAQAAKQGSTSASTVPGLPPGVTEDDILKRAEEIEKARAAATPTSTTTPAPKTT